MGRQSHQLIAGDVRCVEEPLRKMQLEHSAKQWHLDVHNSGCLPTLSLLLLFKESVGAAPFKGAWLRGKTLKITAMWSELEVERQLCVEACKMAFKSNSQLLKICPK